MQVLALIDFSILRLIAENMQNPWMDGLMVFITKLGDGGFIWICCALCLALFSKYRRQVPFLLAALAVSFLIGEEIIKNIVERIRPFQIESISLLIQAPSGYSFPSGHTATSFSCATALWKIDRRMGIAGYFVAGAIGFSRLYLYVHYPTDVLCGIVLGVGTAVGLSRFFQYYRKKSTKSGMDESL